MNCNSLSNWSESPQNQADFRQSQSINFDSQHGQTEEFQDLHRNKADLEELRIVYDSLPCIGFTLNSRGDILLVSKFGAAYLGYEALELTAKSMSEILHGEDQTSFKAKLAEVPKQPEQISQWETRLVRKNGNPMWVKATPRLVSGTESNPIINILCEDITASKQVEETLRESEALHRSILSSISDTVFITNNSGEFTFICPNVETIFGYSWQEVRELGNIVKLLGEPLFVDWQELETSGEIPNIEREIIDKAGKRHTLLVNVKRVSIAEGTLLYSCRDISDRKQAEDELKQYRHHLEHRVAERTAELVRANEQLEQEIAERKQAEEALRLQFQKERLIGAIAQRIHQSLNLEEILNTTVAEVRQFLICDRVIIFRLHGDGSGIVVVESVGAEWTPMAGTVINDRYFAEAYIRLYQQGRVQAVEDIYTAGLTQCHVELLAKFQARANLVVPIVHEEQLWGLLVAQQCAEPRKWQSLEIDLLKSLATQTAIAIQQSELYQQAQTEIAQRQQAEAALRQQFQRERLIGAITQRIRKSLNLDEILNATVAEVRQVLQTDRVIIFRFEPDWSGNVVVESVDERWTSILGANIYDPCFEEEYVLPYQQGRVKAIEDICTENLSQCHFDLLAQFQVRANLVVPILHGEQLWGLLVAHHCAQPRRWQQFEIDLLCSLASQVAIALHQSQLYEQAQSLAKREQALNQLTQAIRSSLNLKTIFSTAAREIGELLQVDRVNIVQYVPERQLWLHVWEYGKQPNLAGKRGGEISDENNLIAERLKRLEIVKINDTEGCEDEINKRLAREFPGAWLMVPLHFGGSVWGSITLARDVHPYHWQDSEVELLCAVADQVAIAIQQSQLYEQAQFQAKREQALNQLTQAIRRSLDLQTIFSTATHEIEKLLQVDRALIVQYLPERQLWVHVAESCKDEYSPLGLSWEIPNENNPIAESLKRLEVVRIEDTNSFEDETNKTLAQKFPGAWLLVPLHSGSSVWGALTLMMHASPYHWQESQVELICEVADQLAIALQQAELYQQSRTATATALEQAQQLERTVQQLHRTHAQLVQSEKMSSLGQLVAGVAHEINNPVSFIYGNLVHAYGYTQDLLNLIQLYQQEYPNPTPEIQSEIEEIDLDFLIEDLPKLLDSMKFGAERICEIVGALRNFSRLAEAEMKAVDIHEGLDSTLMILQNRLRAHGHHPEIRVIKEYGNLPKVECYAGQLNQVFMNLFTNAIDALEELNVGRLKVESSEDNLQPANLQPATQTNLQPATQTNLQPSNLQPATQTNLQPATPYIRIRTEVLDNQQIAIRIADNGPGMTEQVKVRLFDPFFTTKPVGTGTGLGLSISYQIVVEKHGGQLHCHSQLGQGTEFVISIPSRQPDENS